MDQRKLDDQQPSPAEDGSGVDAPREAGFIPLPMRQPRLRGGDPPPDPPKRGDDESPPLE